MRGMRYTAVDAHTPHQGRDLPPPNGMTLLPEEITQHAGAGKRILQMQLVNPTHQRQCRVRNWLRLIVRGGPSQVQHLALSRRLVTRGSDQSSLCAQQARLGERTF